MIKFFLWMLALSILVSACLYAYTRGFDDGSDLAADSMTNRIYFICEYKHGLQINDKLYWCDRRGDL